MAGAVEGDTFVGRKAQELRGLLRIKCVPNPRSGAFEPVTRFATLWARWQTSRPERLRRGAASLTDAASPTATATRWSTAL